MMKYVTLILMGFGLMVLTACASSPAFDVDAIVKTTNTLVAAAESPNQKSDNGDEIIIATETPTETSTSTPTKTNTPTATIAPATATPEPPTATPITSPCDSVTYRTHISVGQRAHVLPQPPQANRVRISPNRSAEIIGKIQPTEAMTILDGPKCSDSWIWWYVQADGGAKGWTAEGKRGEYWLAPGEPTVEASEPTIEEPASTSCGSVPTPRLIVGGRARMVDSVPNTLRSGPRVSAPRVGSISQGDLVEVLSGPTCDQDKARFYYWQVRTDSGVIGWTAEGEHSIYWLEATESTAAPQTTGEARTISLRPACGKRLDVSSVDRIILRAYWGLNGQELARMSSDAVNIAILLDGRRLESSRQPVLLSATDVPCGTNLASSYWLVENAYVGNLSPGRHAVTVQYTFDEQLTDGYDLNRDGRLDSYGPGGDIKSISTDYVLITR